MEKYKDIITPMKKRYVSMYLEIENLEGMFRGKYKRLAERYGRIEKLTLGILYTYGVVEANFLRQLLCRYMDAIVTPQELNDIYFERLNLNYIVLSKDVVAMVFSLTSLIKLHNSL